MTYLLTIDQLGQFHLTAAHYKVIPAGYIYPLASIPYPLTFVAEIACYDKR